MQLSAKALQITAAAGLIISLAVHILSAVNLYLAPNLVILILTAGIIFIWLQSSRQLRKLHQRFPEQNPWKTAFSHCPAWLKYTTYFFIIYSLINFGLSVQIKPGDGYINTSVSAGKLRNISGFWLAFYTIGITIAQVSKNQSKTDNPAQ